ncbi:mCG148146 [Mus musculus]|jgi:hypothetical protein|nr:mCG148146 [Mus musculus]
MLRPPGHLTRSDCQELPALAVSQILKTTVDNSVPDSDDSLFYEEYQGLGSVYLYYLSAPKV